MSTKEISRAYRFCPLCGAPRQSDNPPVPYHCHACGYTMYFGPVTAVGGIITDDADRVLLIERARDPGAGKLGMPGGFVDPYESAEDCLHREVWEEVGLEIHQVKFLLTAPNRYTYHNIANPVLDIFYHAKVKGLAVIKPEATEVANWHWSEITSELLDRMAFESNRKALEFFLRSLD